MQYDSQINQIVERLKTDKTVVQPWRNKAVARLQEAQAFVRMGQTTTYQSPNKVTGDNEPPVAGVCTCPPGALDQDCPVHKTG